MSATYEPLCEHGRRLKDCALCRPVEEDVRTGINVYVCQKCGGYTVTIDVDEGTTPFMLMCRASGKEGDCLGQAFSSFYPKGPKPPHIPEPAWEWYKPTEAEARKQDKKWRGMYEHYRNGGLFLRKRVVASRLAVERLAPNFTKRGEMRITNNRQYLGDGVYAAFDGYQVWLTTDDGTSTINGNAHTNSIALEPAVYAALVRYMKALRVDLMKAEGFPADMVDDLVKDLP